MTNDITSRTALIAGGGIAGTVAALALHKAGYRPRIFEAFDRGADGVGAFLTLAANGLDALRAVDIDAGDLTGAFDTPCLALSLADGTPLGEFPGAAKTIRRADLYCGLRDACQRRGIAIEYGRRLAAATRLPDGRVHVRCDDGSELSGDLLIGADGLHSRVRRIIDPGAPRPQWLGLLNTGGYARGVSVPGPVGTWQMIFGKRCFFAYVPHPNGEVWWFANPARRKEPTAGELAAIDRDTWRRELLDLFRRDATPATRLIDASDHIFAGFGTYDLAHVPVWHRDRMIVIGDAAHATSPSSGQGASMALEDAVVLAMCLRDCSDIDVAFLAYERQRRARVERVVAQGRRNGDGKTPGLLGRLVRDLVLRLVIRRLARAGDEGNRWLHGHHIDWDRPLPAPA